MTGHRRAPWAAAAFAAMLAAPALAAEPPSLDQLVGFFDSIALQDDNSMFGSAGTVPKPLSRWEGPIRVHIEGGSSGMIARLDWHLERFRLLSGADIARVTRREDANLRISLTTSAEVTQRAGSADTLCLTQYEPDSGAIDTADIYIPVGETMWLDNCMAHELMHAVGFYAHPKDNGNRSVLEQGAPARMRTFTALDATAIRMLYDPRLRIGLTRDRALPIARALAEQLLRDWPADAADPEPGDPLDPDGFLARTDPAGNGLAADQTR
ncbi:MAG: DUF2927 domain-containing protein [Alphaproteobacteria bacterium]